MKKSYIFATIKSVVMCCCFICCSESLINQAAFHPQPGSIIDLTELPSPIEQHFLKTSDSVEISTFYLPRINADKTILFFHGNAGNASQRLPIAKELWEMNSNVLVVDYRGYGLSAGEPSEAGLFIDARAALSFLIKEQKIPIKNIYVLGRSLGSAVAIDLAQDQNFAGIILVSPLSSGKEVAEKAGLGVSAVMIGNPFNSMEKLKHLHSPMLILHGDQDQVLPIEMGLALKDASQVPTRFVTIHGAGHNNIIQIDPGSFYKHINTFCSDIMHGGTELTGKN
ncbi:alpha/beta hydrolase [bacterium]|nr:alpha/beta hydrolase [bacterium]